MEQRPTAGLQVLIYRAKGRTEGWSRGSLHEASSPGHKPCVSKGSPSASQGSFALVLKPGAKEQSRYTILDSTLWVCIHEANLWLNPDNGHLAFGLVSPYPCDVLTPQYLASWPHATLVYSGITPDAFECARLALVVHSANRTFMECRLQRTHLTLRARLTFTGT